MDTQVVSSQLKRTAARKLRVRFLGLILAVFLTVGMVVSAQADGGSGGNDVTLSYTKWFTPSFPTIGGLVGGDIVGTLGGKVDSAIHANGGVFLTAHYEIIAGDLSFSALLTGFQDSQGAGVLSGPVTKGWLEGESLLLRFQVYRSCTVDGVTHSPCFIGVMHVTG